MANREGAIGERAIGELPPVVSGLSLTAAAASFTLTGVAIVERANFACAPASFALTGGTVVPVSTADPAAFTLSGQAALFATNAPAAVASFTLSGQAAQQAWPAAAASFTLSGAAAGLVPGLGAAPGAFVLSGQAVLASANFIASAASYSLSGVDAQQAWPAAAAAFTLSGQAALFSTNAPAAAAAFTLTGQAAQQAWPVTAAAFTLSGQAALFATSIALSPGAFTLAGVAAQQAWPAAAASFALTPQGALAQYGIIADVGAFFLFGRDTLAQFTLLSPPTREGAIGEYAIAEAPNSNGFARPADGATFALTGNAIAGPLRFTADAASFTLSGQLAGIGGPASAASFTLSGQAALFATREICSVATFTLNGQPAGFALASAPAAFTLSGQAIVAAYGLGASAASYTLTGQSIAYGNVAPAAFALSGQAIAERVSLAAGAGSFALTGIDSGFVASIPLFADAAAFTLTGQDAQARSAYASSVAAFTLAAQAIAGRASMPASAASFTLTGRSALFNAAFALSTGNFRLSGFSVVDITGPSGDHIFLIDLQGHDGTTLHDFHIGTKGFTSLPTDAIASTTWKPRVIDPGFFERNLFAQGQTRGRAEVSPGAIVIASGDAGNGETLDDWLSLGFDGRPIVIKALPSGAKSLSQASVLFGGKADRLSSTDPLRQFSISIGDRLTDLQQPLLTNRFAGTTTTSGATAEGNVDLGGQVKQMCWGNCAGTSGNVPLQLANPFDLIYLASYVGAYTTLVSIVVKDGGNALTNDGDDANISALQSATIAAGHYRTCLAAGLVRLGGLPVKTLTADVVEGATADDRTAGQIAKRMLLHYGVDVANIVTGSVDALDALNDAECCYFSADDKACHDAVQEVLDSINAAMVQNTEGPFEFSRFGEPVASPILTYDLETQALGNSLDRIDGDLPTWRVILQWGPIFTPQSDNDLDGVVSAEDRLRVKNAFRTITVEDASVKTKHLNAGELTVKTFITDPVAAAAEANRLLDLHKVERENYQVTFSLADAWRAQPGVSITLVHPTRLQLSGGKPFNVLGRRDNYSAEQISVRVWG